MKVRDIVKEINLYGCMHDFKHVSFEAFLIFYGYILVNRDDFKHFEYSDYKAYLDLEIRRI